MKQAKTLGPINLTQLQASSGVLPSVAPAQEKLKLETKACLKAKIILTNDKRNPIPNTPRKSILFQRIIDKSIIQDLYY